MLDAIHVDLNGPAQKPETVSALLRAAAACGKNAVLWEVEDKVRWDACPGLAHPEAFDKATFRRLLDEARSLGLEPVPLVQSFGHAEWALAGKGREALREDPSRTDCYCTSSPEAREFVRALVRECLDLFGPVRLFHLGGDEAYRFGTCPKCSARDRFGLFAEHAVAVARDVRAAGARPMIWDDMVRHDPRRLAETLPKDFVLAHWTYGPEPDPAHGFSGPTDYSAAGALAAAGFDVAICDALSCWGDDPFIPRYGKHLPNVASARAEARRRFGLVETSWSVRHAPKALQLPMLETDPAAALAARFSGGTGGPPAVSTALLARVSEWDGAWGVFCGICWNGLKDSALPPADLVAQRVAERPEEARKAR
ncbi:MAG: family 20 glycosylhydrolase, partial [Kiritimatiellae bacterium]|nr:family 20 glycosylhydrolase [Kiritimatiellia bacterium]